jgi:hypothetical protein
MSTRIVPKFDSDIARVDWQTRDANAPVQKVLRSGVPVVVSNGLGHWAAVGKWTPEYLRDEFGDTSVELKGKTWRLGDLADRILASSRENPAPYLHNYPLDKLPKRMRADIGRFPECTGPNWLDSALLPRSARRMFPEMYFGGTGAIFPVLHYDDMHMHAVLMQIYGEKEYMAFAPDQTPYLYSRGGIEINKSAIDDPEGADPERFPLYARAKGTRFLLRAGEMLFVPAGWWHTVRILTPSITVSVNSANSSNWRNYIADYRQMMSHRSPVAAALLHAYLTAFGRLQ